MIINELYLLNKLFVKSDKVTSLFEKKKEKKIEINIYIF